jgi:DNA/RNA endonuclease YhcR with UshA esterase domain
VEFDDFLLRRLCLLLSVAGLGALLVLSGMQSPKQLRVDEIGNSFLSEKVSTKGIVMWSRLAKGVLIFEIQDIGRIKCVVFTPAAEHLAAVRKGRVVEVEGTVKMYKGALEIVAERVKAIGPG